MNAGWVGASVKARLQLERRLGSEHALRIAEAPSLSAAAAALAATTYAQAAVARRLEQAQRSVAASTLLQLRVLSAWLPRGATGGLRALAGWFELANIEDRLAYFSGGPLHAPFELGALSSAWGAAAATQSAEELRTVLARSSWGDPGSAEAAEVQLALRLAWARRVAVEVPQARAWAAGAAAILLAEELFLAGRPPDRIPAQAGGLGGGWRGAQSPAQLRGRLPRHAAWALRGVERPEELWRAELGWWRTAAAEAESAVHAGRPGAEIVVGVAVLLALDAVRVSTALAVAASGGAAEAREVLDALC